MFLLSLNLLLTFLIFDVRAPFTEQYQRLVPNAGTFGYTLYQISPLLMAVVYSFFNSLALALFAVFALAIQMIVKFKNQYVAIVIPVILLYAITFAFDSVPLLLPYDIRIIIQPRSANAITEIVTKKDFEITFCAWIAEILPVTPIHEGGVILPRVACGVEIPGQLILFHAHIPGHGTSPKWFSIT